MTIHSTGFIISSLYILYWVIFLKNTYPIRQAISSVIGNAHRISDTPAWPFAFSAYKILQLITFYRNTDFRHKFFILSHNNNTRYRVKYIPGEADRHPHNAAGCWRWYETAWIPPQWEIDFFCPYFQPPNASRQSFRRITVKAMTQITTDISEPVAVAKPIGKSVSGKSCEVR